jgi:hypothetical protein
MELDIREPDDLSREIKLSIHLLQIKAIYRFYLHCHQYYYRTRTTINQRLLFLLGSLLGK